MKKVTGVTSETFPQLNVSGVPSSPLNTKRSEDCMLSENYQKNDGKILEYIDFTIWYIGKV